MMPVIAAATFAFFVALVLGKPLIRRLEKLRAGQVIRDVGPDHKQKAGTPTMGGLLLWIGAAAGAFAVAEDPLSLWPLFAAMIGYGLIGLLDDLSSVVAKRSLGLKARQKLLLQIAIGAVVAWAAWHRVGPELHVPFMTELWSVPGWLYGLIAVGTLVGTSNAVNLADGLDGLVAGSAGVAAFTMAYMALRLGHVDTGIFAAAIGGACLGFAWFNAHPAQVFMGDTGSLALGGALAAVALFSGLPLLLVVVGGLFVVITLSVILQVAYFRLTGGKRIFRMSPLHHHFELVGWAETQIVTRFWLVALLFAAAGIVALR